MEHHQIGGKKHHQIGGKKHHQIGGKVAWKPQDQPLCLWEWPYLTTPTSAGSVWEVPLSPGAEDGQRLAKDETAGDQRPKPCLLAVYRGIILPSYMGIITSHCKDSYQPSSIMECQQGFERCSGDFDSLFCLGWRSQTSPKALKTCEMWSKQNVKPTQCHIDSKYSKIKQVIFASKTWHFVAGRYIHELYM